MAVADNHDGHDGHNLRTDKFHMNKTEMHTFHPKSENVLKKNKVLFK